MKNFWAYISNGEYSVGTTGQTVYLYDKDGNEIGKFKDIKYGYTPMFSPDGKIFVVKSSSGQIAVYSLESRSLIKKFRFSKINGGQDYGFCFSPDGKLFLNIESHFPRNTYCDTYAISVYNTEDFSLMYQVFPKDNMLLYKIEFDVNTNLYYVLGRMIGPDGFPFVAKFSGKAVFDIVKISESEEHLYSTYLRLKSSGFAEKAFLWSYSCWDLDDLRESSYSLAKLHSMRSEMNLST